MYKEKGTPLVSPLSPQTLIKHLRLLKKTQNNQICLNSIIPTFGTCVFLTKLTCFVFIYSQLCDQHNLFAHKFG